MANYSHFVVYFDVDKSIQTLPKSRLKTEDTDGKVTVLWKTSKMMENGIEVVEDMPYDGTVVFSGSLIKCRAYTNQVNEEIDTTSENALKDLISLGKEMMTAGGKRGASLKLKRAIAAETSDLVIKKSKKEKLCKASNAKNITEKKATESKSKRQTANELKLKEMMAFAGIGNPTDEDALSSSPSKLNKGSPRLISTAVDKSSPSRGHRPSTNPKKQILQKSPGGMSSSPVETSIPSRWNRPLATPQKQILQKSPARISSSPVETFFPSRGHRPLATPQKQILQKSPACMSSSPVETFLPSRGHRPSVTPKRQILEKSRLSSSPCIETSCAVPPATTLTREQDNKKQQKTRTSTPRKLAHSPGPVTNLSHIIGSSFDVLNNENNQFPQYQDVSFQPDEVVGEFGYNNTSTCSTSSFPVQPLIDYYQGLPYEAQTQILSFCHVLTSTLHQYIYGTTLDNVAECSEMSMQRNSAQDGFMSQEVQQLDAKPQAERKLPLIKDADDIYKDVLVNPATLRTAEMKALTAKNPAIYLLNKVLDLVFFEEELRITKGARGLDKHKMDALKEYMFSKCQSLQIEHLRPILFNTTIQNKIENIRQKKSCVKGSVKLSSK